MNTSIIKISKKFCLLSFFCRLVYELKQEDDIPSGIVPWNFPGLWKYKIHVDIEHLRQALESINWQSNGNLCDKS